MDDWVRRTSLLGDEPLKALHESAGNATPALTLPLFATMIATISHWRIVEGLLFHRLRQRAMFFFVLKQRGAARLPEMKPIVRIIDAGRLAMTQHLELLERALAENGGPWIVGEQFTLADVGMMAILDRLREACWEDILLTDDRPLVQKYWTALKERPSYSQAIAAFEHTTVVQGTKALAQLVTEDENFRDVMTGDAV